MGNEREPPAPQIRDRAEREHVDALLDEALTETFPASDSVAINFEVEPRADTRAKPPRFSSTTADTEKENPDVHRRVPFQPRLDYWKPAPQGIAAFRHLQTYVDNCGLEHSLLELVKIRASQINGCAYCIDMHTKDARRAGESEQRLYALSAWRETPFFTERERAALAWTEVTTRIFESHIADGPYDELQRHLSDKEIVDLTLAVIAINGWNRLAIPFRTLAGTYRPREAGTAIS
jgi:AhpD family alkylhydroperoxidase